MMLITTNRKERKMNIARAINTRAINEKICELGFIPVLIDDGFNDVDGLLNELAIRLIADKKIERQIKRNIMKEIEDNLIEVVKTALKERRNEIQNKYNGGAQ